MALSRKDYDVIAEIMANVDREIESKTITTPDEAWQMIRVGLADYFVGQNNNFDLMKFMGACRA